MGDGVGDAMNSRPTYSISDLIAWCEQRREELEFTADHLRYKYSKLNDRDRREAARFAECRKLLERLVQPPEVKR